MTKLTIEFLNMDSEPTIAEIIAADPAVSSLSRWSSPSWYFDVNTGGLRPRDLAIHWPEDVEPSLLNSAKYLTALLFLERDGRVIYKPTTAPTFCAGIRHLLGFASAGGYRCFSQFDRDSFEKFKNTLQSKLADPEWYADELLFDADGNEGGEQVNDSDDGVNNVDISCLHELSELGGSLSDEATENEPEGDELTQAAAYYRFRTWKLFFEHSKSMEKAGVPSLRFDPFQGTSIAKATLAASSIADELIPPIPAPVTTLILSTAQEFLKGPAEDVLQLQQKYLNCLPKGSGPLPAYRRQYMRDLLETFEFSLVDGSPWYDSGPMLRDSDMGVGHIIRDLIDCIRDAATHIILGGVGNRIGELCSIPYEPIQKLQASLPPSAEQICRSSSLPPCVFVTTSKTGLNEHFFMRGFLFKHQQRPKDVSWLIGARPRGDEVEPPVLVAIRVLERLYGPWRSFSSNKKAQRSLIVGFRSAGMPANPKTVIPISANVIRHSHRRFVKRFCHIDSLASQAKTDPSLRPYVVTDGACIRPHQWRKTFARYMLTLDERMIAPIARRFKHMSIAVTENSYSPRDPSMLAAHDSVSMQETARFLYERRRGAGGTFGRLDNILAQHRKELEELIGDLPFAEALPELKRYVFERDIRIFHSDHGRCLFAANPDQARCHDASATSSWRNKHPNYLTRTPTLCSGCVNFSISGEHVGYWRERYILNQRTWLRSDRSAQFRVIQKRAEQAAKILLQIGEGLPDVLQNEINVSK